MSLVSAGGEIKQICVISDEAGMAKGQHWAQFLNCPLNPPSIDPYYFRFNIEGDRVFVRDQDKRLLEFDFDKNHLDYERKGHRGKQEMIAKALGAAKGCKKILDLSVGMAVDSVFLTQLGFQVTGVERSRVLYALLSEAFAKTQKEYLKSYKLYFANSLDFLREQKGKVEIDAIYFDPMYPHKKKSSLPKQEMVVFRDLVGHDDDAAEVLKEALKWPVRRVVVKRPIHAEQLLPGVIHSFEGKVVRYDSYVVG